MEEDLENLTLDDLQTLYQSFSVVRSGNYAGSEV